MSLGSNLKVAILIDGAFFLMRYKSLFRKKVGSDLKDAKKIALDMHKMLCNHAKGHYLYRILYYDAEPFTGKIHHPMSGKFIDFAKSDVALFKLSFYDELRHLRKVALRLGHVMYRKSWLIRPETVKRLFRGEIRIADLKDDDVYPDIRQKGIDIRMTLDVASLAYKKLVDQVVIVAADSDFVPVTKLARREGLDVILDPLWSPYVTKELLEHVDGLQTYAPKP
jgi:uncharacterized LabA/DUF88 family protein